MEKRLLYNAICTPDGTVLHSKHRHDFIKYKDKNGYVYMNDGGNEYKRRGADKFDYEDISVCDDGKHKTRRKYLYWGKNYDENMKLLPKTEWISIENISTEHITAIISGGYVDNNSFYKEVFTKELKFRKKNGK